IEATIEQRLSDGPRPLPSFAIGQVHPLIVGSALSEEGAVGRVGGPPLEILAEMATVGPERYRRTQDQRSVRAAADVDRLRRNPCLDLSAHSHGLAHPTLLLGPGMPAHLTAFFFRTQSRI